MPDYPALRAIFGVPVSKIDAAAIERAITAKTAENDQLDWKSEAYAKGAGAEIAKDIASFANHRGGIIVLGVSEEYSAAAKPNPVKVTSVDVQQQVRMAVASNVSPFLGGITVYETGPATSGNGHYVIIEVAPSRDAPHALSPNGPNGITLSYPVRNGAETHHLKEFEVAARYRDRLASRADIAASLASTHDNGLLTVQQHVVDGNFDKPTISVAAVPVNAGFRPVGIRARKAETEFLTAWEHRASLPGHQITFREGHSKYVVRPAQQRTVFTTPDTVIELGHLGGGFICHTLDMLPSPGTVEDTARTFGGAHTGAVLVPAERIEWALFVTVNFLIDHAIDSGVSGDVELRAQLHFSHASRHNGGICIPSPESRPHEPFHELPRGSRLSPIATPVQTTTTITDDDSRRPAAAASFFLAADIFAEFGVDDPHIFDETGDSIPANMGPNFRNVEAWLSSFNERSGTLGKL